MPFDTFPRGSGVITQKPASALEVEGIASGEPVDVELSTIVDVGIKGVAGGEPIDVEISTIPTINVAHASRRPALSIGAEAADAILLSVQLRDGANAAVAEATNIAVHLVDTNGIDSLAAAFTLADGGAGAVVSTTGNARLLYTTDATGLAQITVTDVAGASGATIYAIVTVVSGASWTGGQDFIAITFD